MSSLLLKADEEKLSHQMTTPRNIFTSVQRSFEGEVEYSLWIYPNSISYETCCYTFLPAGLLPYLFPLKSKGFNELSLMNLSPRRVIFFFFQK